MEKGVRIIQEWAVPVVNIFNDDDFEKNVALVVENILSMI